MSEEELYKLLARIEQDKLIDRCGFEFADGGSCTFENIAICYDDRLKLSYIVKKIQQENTQLKETISIINSQLEEVKNNKTDYTQINILEMKNTKLKSVLKEIREYIDNYDVFKEFSFPLMKRAEENQVKSSIKYEFDKSIKKSLLEIIDKAGIGE